MLKALQDFFAPYVQSRFDAQLASLSARLEQGEKLVAVTIGSSELGSIITYAATDRRIIRFAKSWLGEDLKYIPYDSIHYIDENRNFRSLVITISFGTNGLMRLSPSGHDLYRERTEIFLSELRRRTLERKKKPVAAKKEEKLDIPQQIKKLGELKKAKLITDKEFETKKKDLLSRM